MSLTNKARSLVPPVFEHPITVTSTFLPSLERYNTYLEQIWDKKWLTNRGPLARLLEDNIKTLFKSDNVILTTNGTLPLQIALKALGDGGEIITTPFSYIATASAIGWENCKPVFVDIDPEYLTIDENKIESAITDKTTAVLATHVFGNPCNVEAIAKIANKYNLSVIYDAAHCFGVEYKGNSLFNYGDVSTCSFHATKIFHTGEGGAIFVNKSLLYDELFYRHNFGHISPTEFGGLGINAKISELQAAMGLSVLPYMDEIYNSRREIVDQYNDRLIHPKIAKLKVREGTKWNYSYYPIILPNETSLLNIISCLNFINVFPRRYFYPSLNTLDFLNKVEMPISDSISSRVMCLPLYVGLEPSQIDVISEIILDNI